MIGITLSEVEIEIAKRVSLERANDEGEDEDGFIRLGKGKVKFLVLDAEINRGSF